MRANVMEIPGIKRESQRRLELPKGLRDAVSDHMRGRWPSGTAKHAARAYGLSLDRAREAVAGRASLTTIETITKHGGWSVILPVLAEVIGHGVDQHIAQIRGDHEERGKRLSALFGDVPRPSAVPDLGAAGVELRDAGRRGAKHG